MTPERSHCHTDHSPSFGVFIGAPVPGTPVIRITLQAHRRTLHSLCARPAEAGGLLLGPADDDRVTEFYLDEGGRCTGASYAPDTQTLNRLLREVWGPARLEVKGFCHSHPDGVTELSHGDLVYIGRILESNPRMTRFVAPIVIPTRFWLRPFVVRRAGPLRVSEATLRIIDDEGDSQQEVPA